MIGDNVNIGQRLNSAPKRGDDFRDHLRLIKDKILVGERQEIEVREKGKGGRLRSRRAQVAFPVTEESRR